MDLFNQEPYPNILPYDGDSRYYGKIFSASQADSCYQLLLENIDWAHDEAIMFGKHIQTKRKVAWYGDRPFSYTYSRITKQAKPWTPDLRNIKATVEEYSGETFNSCLLNLYHDGGEGMAYHSDDEKDLGPAPSIASISLGAERKFHFKHKQTKERVSIFLEHGSLLVMRGLTQHHWLHQLPKTKKVLRPRINLTFRTIYR